MLHHVEGASISHSRKVSVLVKVSKLIFTFVRHKALDKLCARDS